MRRLSEPEALALLQRSKAAYRSHIKLHYEPAAKDCKTCPTQGICCTDEHFVNVHITRLEAVAIRETLVRTPRLSEQERRAVYQRAHETVARYNLHTGGDTYKQTYSCPLFQPGVGCLVHQRAKPAPCIQHACYENWEDVPPTELQWRAEHRVEHLNEQVYGTAWAWLPTPFWLTLVDPASDGTELAQLAREWSARRSKTLSNAAQHPQRRRSLPVIKKR